MKVRQRDGEREVEAAARQIAGDRALKLMEGIGPATQVHLGKRQHRSRVATRADGGVTRSEPRRQGPGWLKGDQEEPRGFSSPKS